MVEDNNPKDEGLTAEEKAQLEKDIESTKKDLVSDKTADVIKEAKEEAKKEASKEFETNSKIKDLEEELKKEKDAKTELEKKSAEEIEKIKLRVDDMAGSKMPVDNTNPFNKDAPASENPVGADGSIDIDKLSEDEYKDLETNARDLFLKERAMGLEDK